MTDHDVALLIAVAARHLPDAATIGERDGEVALPVLEAGDLAACEPGTPVLILAAGRGEEESRSVGWRASLVAWSQDRPDVSAPGSVDAAEVSAGQRSASSEPTDDDDDDAVDEEEEPRPAPEPVWIVVESLRELAITERIHTNELVSKRERGARFFVPKAPKLVRLPD